MQIVAVVLTVLLIVVLAGSAIAKLARVPAVVGSVTGVGWPADRIWVLAVIELIGAIGLFVGFAVPVIGLAAAVGGLLYFVAAVGSHIRAHQSPAPALGPLVIATATVIAQVVRVAAS